MNHPSPLAQLAALVLGSWFLFALASAILLGYLMPLCALIATLNIRKIRKELEQLNETLSLPSHRT